MLTFPILFTSSSLGSTLGKGELLEMRFTRGDGGNFSKCAPERTPVSELLLEVVRFGTTGLDAGASEFSHLPQ